MLLSSLPYGLPPMLLSGLNSVADGLGDLMGFALCCQWLGKY